MYFLYLVRSVDLFFVFFFCLLSMRVFLASAASRFRCGADLLLYFPAYLPILTLTIATFMSLHIFLFLTYHGTLTTVLSIFNCSYSCLFMCTVRHSGIHKILTWVRKHPSYLRYKEKYYRGNP